MEPTHCRRLAPNLEESTRKHEIAKSRSKACVVPSERLVAPLAIEDDLDVCCSSSSHHIPLGDMTRGAERLILVAYDP